MAIQNLQTNNDKLPILEIHCDECGGTGGETGYDYRWEPCYKCNGSGYLPTPLGKRILSLVRHALAETHRR